MKVKVGQSCPTLCDRVDYTVHGILQQRILAWVADPFSRGPSQPRDRTQVSCTAFAGGFFTSWVTREAQIGKGVPQGWILSSCLFNSYAEYIMQNAGLDEAQARIKIAERNINNLRYADDTTPKAENKEELKSLLRGIHVSPWLIDVNVWQKPLQYCKVISLQLIKINENK